VACSRGHTNGAIRFNPSTDIAGHTPVKSSVQRAIRAAVLSQWKIEPETLEAVWPKKEGLIHVKWSVIRLTLLFHAIDTVNRIAESTFQYTPFMGSLSSSSILMGRTIQPCDCFINVIYCLTHVQCTELDAFYRSIHPPYGEN